MAARKGMVTAVVGKGGTGKTSLSALWVKYLLKKVWTPVLAIDADPSVGLARALGIESFESLGSIREQITGPRSVVPVGTPKQSYLDLRFHEAVVESSGFDLLTMGRPEGPGCYCYVNNLLRESLDRLTENYRWVVIDCEAGMEHISRRTTKDVDYLFVVCDGSHASISTADKILDLIEELRTAAARRILVFNNLGSDGDRVAASLLERIDVERFETYGVIQHDPQVEACERAQRSFLELPDDSPAFVAFERLLEGILG